MDNAWRKCRNRWIWCIDIEQATYLLLVMRNMGIESIDWIQHRYGGGLEGQGVTKDVIYEKYSRNHIDLWASTTTSVT
jgi:hypothetical protein